MEAFLIFCLIVVLLIRWVYIRNRLDEMEERLKSLEYRTIPQPAPRPA